MPGQKVDAVIAFVNGAAKAARQRRAPAPLSRRKNVQLYAEFYDSHLLVNYRCYLEVAVASSYR